MKHSLFLFLIGLAIIGCPNTNPTVDPHPTPVVVDTSFCSAAESNLKLLCNAAPTKNKYCCDTVAPTKKNKTFSQFCQETQNNGIFINPKCLSTITSCDKIDVCTGTKK